MRKRCAETTNACNINEVLCYEMLVKIFMALNVAELAKVSIVCKTWYQACRDPTLWKKLDLSALSSNPFSIPKTLGAWGDEKSSARMTQFLKSTLSLSDGNISCLVFNFYAYLRDEHLISVAERTPNLKRLVLPATGNLSEIGIDLAMRSWRELESMTISGMVNHCYIFSAIGKYCKRISELKFTSGFEKVHADALIKHTPNLKALSIQSIMVNMQALCSAVNNLEHLEVVNICHSLILDRPNEGSSVVLYSIRDLRKHLPIKCMRKLLFCQGKRCIMCKNKKHEGYRSKKPYEIFEGIWREDVIRSLAH